MRGADPPQLMASSDAFRDRFGRRDGDAGFGGGVGVGGIGDGEGSLHRGWAPTASCDKYTTVAGTDLFKGICDVGVKRAPTLESCCRACDTNADCRAFSYGKGFCFFKSCGESETGGVGAPTAGITSGYPKQASAAAPPGRSVASIGGGGGGKKAAKR
ncbi:unnamed protein product [Phaeothamnion confervicola]